MKKIALAAAAAFVAAPAYADDPAADIWTAKCKSCHGADGKADTRQGRQHKIDDMSDPGWQERHSDDQIRKVISEGVPDTKMKPYKDKLSAAEIDALVKHIRSLKK